MQFRSNELLTLCDPFRIGDAMGHYPVVSSLRSSTTGYSLRPLRGQCISAQSLIKSVIRASNFMSHGFRPKSYAFLHLRHLRNLWMKLPPI